MVPNRCYTATIMQIRTFVSTFLACLCGIFLIFGLTAWPAVAQDGPPSSVSVGVGDSTDITITAPLTGPVSLLVTSTRQTIGGDGMSVMDQAQVAVSRLTGGVRYSRNVHPRVGLYGDVQFGAWFGDGVVNPREVWRDVDFRLGGRFYVTDTWGFGASGGYRSIGDDFEVANLFQRPSETPWAVRLFGLF